MKLNHILTLSLSLAFLTFTANAADRIPKDNSITLKWNETEQSIDGFGIAQAGWAKELYAFKNREQVMDKMFGKDGLRLNILRGEVFPHYWENEQDKDFNLNDDIHITLSDSDFIKKSDDLLRRGQLWITLEAKNKYHVDKLMFSAWSAPAWMKTNGQPSQGQLKPECYQDFADYLAAFYKAYKSKGITPYALSPSNEPGYAAPWNSSVWSAEEMGKFITAYLGPTFKKQNIPAKIIFGENPLWSVVIPQISVASSKDFTGTILQKYPEIKDFNIIAAGHGYSLSPDIMPIPIDKEYLKTPIIPFDLAEQNHIPVWVTEISEVTPLDVSMKDGLNWASTFHNYLTQANVNAIVWWAGAMPTSNNESLIILDKNRTDYTLAKRYDVFGNFSRYIPEGSKRMNVSLPADSSLQVSAYQKGKDFVIVAINGSDEQKSTELKIDGAKVKGTVKTYLTDADDRWNPSEIRSNAKKQYILTLPPCSVMTITGTIN